jgi:hypothetical protein
MIKLAAAAVGLSVIAAVLATAFTTYRSTPEPAKAAAAEPQKAARIIPLYHKIEERAPMDPVVVAMTDISKAPIVPKVEPVVSDNKTFPNMAKPEPEPELQLPTRRHYGHGDRERVAEADLCARHGLRRVETHNGKSWRCK